MLLFFHQKLNETLFFSRLFREYLEEMNDLSLLTGCVPKLWVPSQSTECSTDGIALLIIGGGQSTQP